MGEALVEPYTADGDGPGGAEEDGTVGWDDTAERLGLGVGVRVGRGVRDGLGDRVAGAGLDEAGAGAGEEAGPVCWAAAGAGAGRTRMYSASTARNRTVSTTVETRGR